MHCASSSSARALACQHARAPYCDASRVTAEPMRRALAYMAYRGCARTGHRFRAGVQGLCATPWRRPGLPQARLFMLFDCACMACELRGAWCARGQRRILVLTDSSCASLPVDPPVAPLVECLQVRPECCAPSRAHTPVSRSRLQFRPQTRYGSALGIAGRRWLASFVCSPISRPRNSKPAISLGPKPRPACWAERRQAQAHAHARG